MVFFETDCILLLPKEVGGVNLEPWSLYWQTRDNTVWLDGKAELVFRLTFERKAWKLHKVDSELC